jgi:hypothetical protein
LPLIICAFVIAACGSDVAEVGAEPTTTTASISTSTLPTTSTSATTVATTLQVPSTTIAPPTVSLPLPPATPPARLDAPAIAVRRNEILEFDVSDGSFGRQLFVADEVASGGVSVRRVNGRPEIYVAPRGAVPCTGSITRIDDGGVHDLGLSGTAPRPSPMAANSRTSTRNQPPTCARAISSSENSRPVANVAGRSVRAIRL